MRWHSLEAVCPWSAIACLCRAHRVDPSSDNSETLIAQVGRVIAERQTDAAGSLPSVWSDPATTLSWAV
jgi:hypothetical protein